MQIYTAPLRDMRFVLQELHRDDGFDLAPGQGAIAPDVSDAVLAGAARFCQDVLLPLNQSGDREGCRLEDGTVRTPTGFAAAYRQFTAAGWNAVATPVRWGGQGLPQALAKQVEEMVCSANLSFSLYPGLTTCAIFALDAHANDALKAAYLPRLVSGQWTGAMCLTEPQCGSDLGLLQTRAQPIGTDEMGLACRLSGTKIFISAGDHDLADNVVHLVLARLPDAAPGTRGISLFLVPRQLPDGAGDPGAANGVSCPAIEHKMGLAGSATCQIVYDQAQGWLVGDPGRGLQAMFAMMNAARLGVGIQGLAVGEAAYQSAVWYARQRLQGRKTTGACCPALPADPIIVHADVRRMLMTMRAYNEGCRALAGWVARALDAQTGAATPETRRAAGDFVALMTPVVKALFTDLGLETASLAVQVYGGHGFIRDSGVEQYMRDCRIAMLYEGTNGIQALDLVARKLPMHDGRLVHSLFDPIAAFIAAHQGAAHVANLTQAFGLLQDSTALIAARAVTDPEASAAVATPYLRLMGLTALGFCFAKSANIAASHLAGARADADADADFYRAKLHTARFFFDCVAPQTISCHRAITAGKVSVMAMDDAMF